MTGDTLSTQTRRFCLLAARWQIDPPPAAAVSPPARSSQILLSHQSRLDRFLINQRASYRPSHRHLVSSSHLVPVVVSSASYCRLVRCSVLLVARRLVLPPSRPSFRSSSRLLLSRPQFCSSFCSSSHPPPSLRRLISSVVPCRRCGLVRRSVLLAACRLIPRSVPRLVYRSARRRLIRHLVPGVISSAAFP